MATARNVMEVVQKLASDHARPHDEGVKLLGTGLQGDRVVTFCRLLARNTVEAKPAQLASAVGFILQLPNALGIISSLIINEAYSFNTYA
ncbi:serine/threonine-protein kinase ATM [Hordeum vulgare]|nr:serine/threonine-protein kinase ATM [Hordeum vulgare]